MATVPFSLRLDEKTNEKLNILSDKETRSKNQQIEFIIKKYIKDYENINGEIKRKKAE